LCKYTLTFRSPLAATAATLLLSNGRKARTVHDILNDTILQSQIAAAKAPVLKSDLPIPSLKSADGGPKPAVLAATRPAPLQVSILRNLNFGRKLFILKFWTNFPTTIYVTILVSVL
jgi:hypothetical protein